MQKDPLLDGTCYSRKSSGPHCFGSGDCGASKLETPQSTPPNRGANFTLYSLILGVICGIVSPSSMVYHLGSLPIIYGIISGVYPVGDEIFACYIAKGTRNKGNLQICSCRQLYRPTPPGLTAHHAERL